MGVLIWEDKVDCVPFMYAESGWNEYIVYECGMVEFCDSVFGYPPNLQFKDQKSAIEFCEEIESEFQAIVQKIEANKA